MVMAVLDGSALRHGVIHWRGSVHFHSGHLHSRHVGHGVGRGLRVTHSFHVASGHFHASHVSCARSLHAIFRAVHSGHPLHASHVAHAHVGHRGDDPFS